MGRVLRHLLNLIDGFSIDQDKNFLAQTAVCFQKATKMVAGKNVVEPVKKIEFLADVGHGEFDLLSPYLEGLRIFKIAGLPLKYENDNGTVVIKEASALKCLGYTLGILTVLFPSF